MPGLVNRWLLGKRLYPSIRDHIAAQQSALSAEKSENTVLFKQWQLVFAGSEEWFQRGFGAAELLLLRVSHSRRGSLSKALREVKIQLLSEFLYNVLHIRFIPILSVLKLSVNKRLKWPFMGQNLRQYNSKFSFDFNWRHYFFFSKTRQSWTTNQSLRFHSYKIFKFIFFWRKQT